MIIDIQTVSPRYKLPANNISMYSLLSKQIGNFDPYH